jgi:hypothetical protein
MFKRGPFKLKYLTCLQKHAMNFNSVVDLDKMNVN